jgi:propionate CoA-transferase
MEKHPIFSEQLIYAQAAKNSGGLVIAQVERVTEFGSLRAQDVKVPGVFVDYVVLADLKNQPQNFAGPEYDPALAGEIRKPLGDVAPMPMDERKICARRAAMELKRGMVGNIGIGVGEGVSNIVAEENLGDLMTLTLESGAIGGAPTGGHKMGCTLNPEAIIDQAYQFDFYDGGGLDICYLGLAEADRHGNLNVSKFAGRVVGPGGFINIAQNAKTAVFCGTFTAKGLKVRTGDGKLAILEEGAVQKFVPEVGQITFSGAYALKSGQKVLYVTERCVFRLTPQGMTLVEVAPGINVEQDIIGRMGFRPAVSPALKLMDERIFLDRPMGLKVNGN